ncbi:MAG: V-type ATP synthase subunit E family protein [Candidatus Pacearchaeota archaeon]|nr:V-type ATP synthase subunit E family protein [Candidatus Pacearchaeota archaeon]
MSIDEGTSRILSGMTDDAKKEAEKLIGEARKMADERITLARGKADTIRKDATAKAAAQAQQTRAGILSGIGVECKREKMRMQDEIIHELLERVRKRIGDAISADDYPAVLSRLITEAAVGLDVTAMTVNASMREKKMISNQMLANITETVAETCGHPVNLELSDAPPLSDQGIVVTAHDGRTAFNNLFSTRIRRFEQKIRNLIYDNLFSDNIQTRQTEES